MLVVVVDDDGGGVVVIVVVKVYQSIMHPYWPESGHNSSHIK